MFSVFNSLTFPHALCVWFYCTLYFESLFNVLNAFWKVYCFTVCSFPQEPNVSHTSHRQAQQAALYLVNTQKITHTARLIFPRSLAQPRCRVAAVTSQWQGGHCHNNKATSHQHTLGWTKHCAAVCCNGAGYGNLNCKSKETKITLQHVEEFSPRNLLTCWLHPI